MEKIKQQAIDLLNKCEVLTLASIDERGCPRPVVLSKIKTEGIDTIWFSTGTRSEKTKAFIKNPKAGVAFYEGHDSVTLTGTIEVVSDVEEKKALWVDWFYEHFPKAHGSGISVLVDRCRDLLRRTCDRNRDRPVCITDDSCAYFRPHSNWQSSNDPGGQSAEGKAGA